MGVLMSVRSTSILAVLVGPFLASTAPVYSQEAANPRSEERQFHFNVKKQALRSALARFSIQAGIDVVGDGALPKEVQAAPLDGKMSAREGLERLLSETNLTYKFSSATSVVILAGDARSARAQEALPEITVTGQATNPLSTMTAPPPYAGGQVATGGQLGLFGNRSVMDTPFNQTSYTAKLAQDQNAWTLDDIVQNDPSVRKGSSPGNGIEDFSIRGFEVTGRDFLFNGLGAIAPTNGSAMMSESVERLEVLKGPNAMLNGIALQGNVGGSINVIPKRATEAPITQFSPDYGMDSQLGGHVDLGRRYGPSKEFGIRFNGVYRDGDTAIDNQSREQRLAALGLDYRGERLRLAADLGYQYDHIDGVRRGLRVSSGLPIPRAPDNRTNYSNPFEYQATGAYYGTVQGELDIAPNITAFTTVGASQIRQDFTTANLSINGADGAIAATTVRNSAYIFDGASGNAGVRGTFDTGPVRHQAVLAYGYTSREWKIAQTDAVNLRPSNLYNPTYTAMPPAFANFDDARKSNDISFSSYIFGDTLSILDERLQLTLGARQQNAKVKRFDRTTGAITSNYDESVLTPMVGLLGKPVQNVSIYANYVEGLQEGGVAPITAANAGEALAPFVAKQYEIGAKWDLVKFTTTLAAFQITQPSAGADPVTNVYEVNGEQRNRGLELNVFGEVTDGVRVLGGATYIDAELTKTTDGKNVGNRPQGVSPFYLVVGTEWDTPFFKGLTLTGRVTRSSSNYLDIANTQTVPGWTRFDIGARYTFHRPNGEPIVVRATVNNVLNANYWTNSSSQLGLSEPRMFKLSASFNF